MLMVFMTTALQAQQRHDELTFPEINRFSMPDVVTFELRNGIKFYLVENRELPLISMTMLVRAGSFMEPIEKTGLASLTGEVMRSGGTTSRSHTELNEMLEQRAASIETGFGLTSGSASMSVLKEDFDDLLPVFLDVVRNPAFPEDRITLSKTQRSSGIMRRNDNAMAVAAREFSKLIYGASTPYARQIEFATLEAITRDDLVAFHQQVMVGRNMMIAVIGDFNARDMRRKLERTFGSIPAGTATRLNLPDVNYEFKPSVNFVAKNDVNQSNIRIGHIGGRRLLPNGNPNPDFAALQLMNEILSGGFSGRLLQVIRTDMGLAYSVGGGFQSLPLYDGVFFVTLSTASANTALAVEATVNEIARLQAETVTQRELDDAKDRILNSLVFRYDSRAAVLNERISNEFNGLPADAFNRYIQELGTVSIADIQRVARTYLQPENMQVLVVGNENEIGAEQLERMGTINRIDITIPRPVVARAEGAGDADRGAAVLRNMASALVADGVTFNAVEYVGKLSQGPMTIDSKVTLAFPDSLVQEMSTAMGEQTLIYANGSAKVVAGPNEQALPPAFAEQLKSTLDRHYLNPALLSGMMSAEYVGEEDEEGEVYAKVFIAELNMTLWVSTATGLPYKVVVKEFNPQMGAEVEAVTVMKDWAMADGVYLAYTTESYANGQPAGSFVITSHTVR